jgi:D-aspartate ligase
MLPILDTSVPALIFKIGRYPLGHGVLGTIRSLGRAGVPTYCVIEDRYVPYAFSRFLSRGFVQPTTGKEAEDSLVRNLCEIGRQLDRPTVLLSTDDETAILMAENADILRAHFLLPAVAPGLPRMLASKHGLSRLCSQHGIATPATAFARTVGQALDFADSALFPIVVKNSEPWKRITAPAVASTTIVQTRPDFISLVKAWRNEPHVILQEYIPEGHAEDWIVHAYFNRNSEPLVAYTGRKLGSYPPRAGVTTIATALRNDDLLAMATRFCRAVGYCGVVDMDWRLDLRDGRHKLVDYNPRIGANFRLFVNEDQVDVVRAQHLDLTGRQVPASPQVFGRKFIVENLLLASLIGGGGAAKAVISTSMRQTELAWFSISDPLPLLVMMLRFTGPAFSRLFSKLLFRTGVLSAHRSRAPGSGRRFRKP